MAKVKITGHASGSGVLTITAPNTSTDRTVTLPDSTGTLLDTTSSLDATKLSGNLPAISGAALTGVGVAGITSAADATAITIDSNEQVGINQATPLAKLQISATGSNNTTFAQGLLIGEGSGSNNASAFYHDASGSTKAVVENRYDSTAGSIEFRLRGSGTTVTPLKIIADGRGVSEFTHAFWANVNQTGTQAIRDSHNISSITDTALGGTRFNFANNMPNTNYAVTDANDYDAGGWWVNSGFATSSCTFLMHHNGSYRDAVRLFVTGVRGD